MEAQLKTLPVYAIFTHKILTSMCMHVCMWYDYDWSILAYGPASIIIHRHNRYIRLYYT